MKIGILGTGMVGQTIGKKLIQVGHQVMMGSRTRQNDSAVNWASAAGSNADHGTFADAAKFGEILINCTAGVGSLDALQQAGTETIGSKILIDIANPLDFSQGFPPTLTICNTTSLGEQIQAAYPKVKVVKTLNTITCNVMVNPSLVPGDHTIFLSGNDQDAKMKVASFLQQWFGWKGENIMDLGDITTARGTEMYLSLWVRLFNKLQNPNFNFHLVFGKPPKSR